MELRLHGVISVKVFNTIVENPKYAYMKTAKMQSKMHAIKLNRNKIEKFIKS